MKNVLICLLMLFSISVYATETTNTNVVKEGEVILQTIDKLTEDGYITEKNATEAKQAYVFDNPELLEKAIEIKSAAQDKIDNDISWTEYITLTNSLLFLSTCFALIAFHGVILTIIGSGFLMLSQIPVIVYQILFMLTSITLTVQPPTLFEEPSFYLTFFGSIANIIVLGWIGYCYKETFEKLLKAITLGVNPETMVNIWLALYFGFFAIWQESSSFGLLSVGFLVAATGFVIIHMGLGIAIGAKEESLLPSIVASNLLILGGYSIAMIMNLNIPYLEHFSVGIEYVCSLALGVCLLIGASPFYKSENGFGLYFLLMIIVSGLGFAGGILFGLDTIAAFTNTFFVLFLIEWILYSVKDTHYSVIMGLLAAILYGIAEILMKFPEYFVVNLI